MAWARGETSNRGGVGMSGRNTLATKGRIRLSVLWDAGTTAVRAICETIHCQRN